MDVLEQLHRQYEAICRYFDRVNPSVVEDAFDDFLDAVGDDALDLVGHEADGLHAMFLEWFLYDYRLRNGNTVIRQYEMEQGGKLPRSKTRLLREAADSQRVGLFWLVCADAVTGTVTLEDALTAERFIVHDRELGEDMGGADAGLFGFRIVRLDGQWRIPGSVTFYRPIKSTERFKRMLADAFGPSGIDFTQLVAMEFDLGASSKDDLTGDMADSGFEMPIDFSGLDAAGRAKVLEDLETRYRVLAARCKGLPAWEDMCGGIRRELVHDGGVVDALTHIFGLDEEHDGGFKDLADMQEATSIFMNAWNVFLRDAC